MQFIASEFLYTAFLFIVVLSFIVFIHELGHFLPARYYGIKVETFSIGFGKEIFGWNDSKGTRWRFSWLPLGGYVRFFGDNDVSSTSVDPSISEAEKLDCLYYRPLKQRVIVSFGGPAANYVLAIFLFFIVFFGFGHPDMSSKIEGFSDNSPAMKAGLMVGDTIKSINGQSVKSLSDIIKVMETMGSATVEVKLERQGIDYNYIFMADTLKIGDSERFILGIKAGRGNRFQLLNSLKSSISAPFQVSWLTLMSLKNMILKNNIEGLGGPLAIAKGIKEAASMGISVVIFYAALISTSLGFFNLLPIPMLDGGHLLFYLIEFILGRPIPLKIQEWALNIGIILLGILFLFVTYKDIVLTMFK